MKSAVVPIGAIRMAASFSDCRARLSRGSSRVPKGEAVEYSGKPAGSMRGRSMPGFGKSD